MVETGESQTGLGHHMLCAHARGCSRLLKLRSVRRQIGFPYTRRDTVEQTGIGCGVNVLDIRLVPIEAPGKTES